MSQQIVNLPLADALPLSSETLSSQEATPLDETSKPASHLLLQSPATSIFSDISITLAENSTKHTKDPCQFVPLDQLSTFKQSYGLDDVSADVALKIGKGSNEDIIVFKHLECIQATSFSTKTIVLIKKLTRVYWQTHQTQDPDGFDTMKVYFFAMLLIAAFEIKELSIEELKTQKEIEIYKMGEQDLYRMATKITEKFTIRAKEHSKSPEEFLEKVVEQFEGEPEILIRRMIITGTDNGEEILGLDFVNSQKDCHIQTQEATDLSCLLQNQEERGDETDDAENNHDCNNLSTQTEGQVTDMDISLSFIQNKDNIDEGDVISHKEEACKVIEKGQFDGDVEGPCK